MQRIKIKYTCLCNKGNIILSYLMCIFMQELSMACLPSLTKLLGKT